MIGHRFFNCQVELSLFKELDEQLARRDAQAGAVPLPGHLFAGLSQRYVVGGQVGARRIDQGAVAVEDQCAERFVKREAENGHALFWHCLFASLCVPVSWPVLWFSSQGRVLCRVSQNRDRLCDPLLKSEMQAAWSCGGKPINVSQPDHRGAQDCQNSERLRGGEGASEQRLCGSRIA